MCIWYMDMAAESMRLNSYFFQKIHEMFLQMHSLANGRQIECLPVNDAFGMSVDRDEVPICFP
jgi:hypothetical protein